MPALDGQVILPNGLVTGAGTAYDIVSIEGLEMPPLRSSASAKLGADGEFAGPVSRQHRVITIAYEIVGTPGADTATKLSAFVAAWDRSSTEGTATFKLPGFAIRRITGRAWSCSWRWDYRAERGFVPAVCEFRCASPVILDDASSTEVLI